jgi:hypothetical protein
MDSKDYPERKLIFERENSFYFWGDVQNDRELTRLRIDSIVGLPNELHGSASLRRVMSKVGKQ